MSIYDICNDFLNIIVDNLESVYADRDKETLRLMELLTGKLEFSKIVKNDVESKGINEESLRKIMMLLIASKAYMYENYACEKKIHPANVLESLQGMIDTFEEMNYNDILSLFVSNDDITNYIIDDFFSYYDLTYIGQSQCKEFIFKNKTKLKRLLAINPYEVFKVYDYIDNKDFIPSEIAIQNFFDLYEEVYSIVNSECVDTEENDSEDEIESLDDEDEEFYEEFLELLKEKYNEKELDEFLLYICSNVCEILSTSNHYRKNRKARELVEYFKETSKEEILNDLKTDYEFASIIMQYFYENNQFISRDELLRRRNKIKHDNKNLVTIKALNPYYEREEKAFTRKKANHHD